VLDLGTRVAGNGCCVAFLCLLSLAKQKKKVAAGPLPATEYHRRKNSISDASKQTRANKSKQEQTKSHEQNKNAPNNRGVLLQPADRVFQCISRHQACLRGGTI